MRVRTPSLLAAACALLFRAPAGIATVGCDPEFSVCVTVIDCANGDPLTGAHVTFLYEPNVPMDGSEGDTDSSGRFCGGDVGWTSPPNPYFVDLEKSGYQDEDLQIDGGLANAGVCMNAAAAADAGTD
jgi:hypothetical protein